MKVPKPPFSPITGKKIGATEKYAEHFTDYQTALAAVSKFKMMGVGYVFREQDNVIGIDWDHCIKAGVIHPIVLSWISHWFKNTYTEYSPNDGIHSICFGTIPKAVKDIEILDDDGQPTGVFLEVYTSGRYFTFTSMLVPGFPLQVSDAQTSVDKLLKEVGGKPGAAAPGAAEPGAEYHPMSKLRARKIYQDNLDNFRSKTAPSDDQNATLNQSAFWAARCFASGVFTESEATIRAELKEIAESGGFCPGIDSTLRSGWDSGLAKGPLQIMEDDDEFPQKMEAIEESI